MFGPITELAILVASLGYPSYASFKASEKGDDDEAKQWLTYWVVFSFLSFFETFTSWAFTWLPWYPEMKLAFILWLSLPKFKGASVMYDLYVSQFFKRHQRDIDDLQNQLQSRLSTLTGPEAMAEYRKYVAKYGQKVVEQAVSHMNSSGAPAALQVAAAVMAKNGNAAGASGASTSSAGAAGPKTD
ncbi:hypothetical protein CBR_g50751 [Chara braunii]|uniref:HVA22-like protein n=1 Tax=Chara braunii TaxID=69332 RepID=A0A388K5R0_CHABU|nr:hypothetical protein CBR_g50751 [Chara braunii]|eukprot:GBG65390.1 hypothetical protein CBR_g50751 [Chara braunii]